MKKLFSIVFIAALLLPNISSPDTLYFISNSLHFSSYSNKEEFVDAITICISNINKFIPIEQRVPTEILVGMAAVESAWGTSRISNVANNIYGYRTWNENVPQIKALKQKNASWGLVIYKNKCYSVLEAIRNINEHPAYKEFRNERYHQLKYHNKLNILELVKHLHRWATNSAYIQIVSSRIKLITKIKNRI